MSEPRGKYSGAIYEGLSPEEHEAVNAGAARIAGLSGPMGAMQRMRVSARVGARLSLKSFALAMGVQIMASQQQFDMPADEALAEFESDLRKLVAEMQASLKARTDG